MVGFGYVLSAHYTEVLAIIPVLKDAYASVSPSAIGSEAATPSSTMEGSVTQSVFGPPLEVSVSFTKSAIESPFLLPFFDCDHFRIPWKDLGHQDALNFLISISTAVGEHRQFVIFVRRFHNGRNDDPTGCHSTQDQVADGL